MLNFIDPIQQRKAMTEAGFSVSEHNIILAEVQNIHYCTDEKPPVPEGMPYVDHDALAEEVSQMTGIDLPTTFYVLTWEFVLELYRPKPEIILSILAAEISSFTGIEESSVYHILLAQDAVFHRIGLYDTEEDDYIDCIWYAIGNLIFGDDL